MSVERGKGGKESQHVSAEMNGKAGMPMRHNNTHHNTQQGSKKKQKHAHQHAHTKRHRNTNTRTHTQKLKRGTHRGGKRCKLARRRLGSGAPGPSRAFAVQLHWSSTPCVLVCLSFLFFFWLLLQSVVAGYVRARMQALQRGGGETQRGHERVLWGEGSGGQGGFQGIGCGPERRNRRVLVQNAYSVTRCFSARRLSIYQGQRLPVCLV